MKNCIGIIVPVYKVEKYITECIESILAQTYANFRLILVNDGSPDNAGKICDEYAKKDSRITVIHQENAGVTRARARGVEEAEDCEWITFVDSDDTISVDYLTTLYNAINESADIVINENLIKGSLPKALFTEHLIQGDGVITSGPVCKLFRKALFNKQIFDIPRNIVIGEDMLMNVRLAFSSQKELVEVINKSNIYYYRQNESSITHSFTSTPEYEYQFQKCLMSSIPNNEKNKYLKFTIKNRLKHFCRFWGYRYCVKGMKNTLFYQELKRDIKTEGYKLSAINRIIFNYKNPIIRFITINTKKVLNKVVYKH